MLFDIIRELKKQGIGIIYISHRLSELLEIGDVCTVMRDGEYIDTVNIKDTTEDELTRLMVGRQVSFEKLENPHLKKDEVVLSVKNLNYKNLVRNVSFDLHKGEILGFAGLVGAGRTETAKTIIGDYKKDSGTVIYKGKEIGTNLSENIKNGIVYLSEDRKDEGLILMHSVAENIALPNLPKLCKPFLNRRKERSVSKDYIKSLKIKTFSELTDAKNLSGGNQQKVVIAKWLYSDADIYIFDEPTRGIDVGAKQEIYSLITEFAEQPLAMILILLGTADEKKAIKAIPWSVLILIAGVNVLMNITQTMGGIDLLSSILASFMTKRTAGSIMGFTAGLMSWFSSANGVVFPTLIPTVPDIASQVGGASVMQIITAIVCSATVAGIRRQPDSGKLCTGDGLQR